MVANLVDETAFPQAQCNDPAVGGWGACPNGSFLVLRVIGHADPAQDQFSATATCLPSAGVEESWSDAEIRVSTKHKLLTSPLGYEVRVFVAFIAADTARVQARIVKPDGTEHGPRYCREIAVTAAGPRLVATLMPITAP